MQGHSITRFIDMVNSLALNRGCVIYNLRNVLFGGDIFCQLKTKNVIFKRPVL